MFLFNKSNSEGFTVVESAFVVIVIGLLFSSILVGQELIYSFKIRNVIVQVKNYKIAKNNFLGKYSAFPGDMTNAESYGLTEGTCPSAVGCAGNGNGFLESGPEDPENLDFWYHLKSAEMIKDELDGITVEYGVGLPITELPKVGIWAERVQDAGNVFQVGRDLVDQDPVNNGHLTTYEASLIDTKFDDGKPMSGSVQGRGPLCVMASINQQGVVLNSQYLIRLDDSKCNLQISMK